MTGPAENDGLEKGLKKPLLSEGKQDDEHGDGECDGSEEAFEESRRPATSIISAYRLLTPSIKVYEHSDLIVQSSHFTEEYNFIVHSCDMGIVIGTHIETKLAIHL